MKRALGLLDGKEWDAQDFSANPKDWRTRHSGHLTCLGCGSRAFFQHTSRRGSQASFGQGPIFGPVPSLPTGTACSSTCSNGPGLRRPAQDRSSMFGMQAEAVHAVHGVCRPH
jgi:hypothetical protein